MILSELTAFLKEIQKSPKKSLSQNFLVDGNIIRKTLELADVRDGDNVLEVGPGPGSLTKALLDRGANVYAVEIDRAFAEHLHRFQNGKLQVFGGDFLKFSMENLPRNMKVVANLPYHITTPILEKIFSGPFSSLTIMVQKEIRDRMNAKEGKNFGSLSLFVQFYSSYVDSFIVPPGCFYPKPKVDSAVMRLDLKEAPNIAPQLFFHCVHTAFKKRRKMLTSSLPYPKTFLQEALRKVGVRPDARPEQLPLEKWVRLVEEIRQFLLEPEEESTLNIFPRNDIPLVEEPTVIT